MIRWTELYRHEDSPGSYIDMVKNWNLLKYSRNVVFIGKKCLFENHPLHTETTSVTVSYFKWYILLLHCSGDFFLYSVSPLLKRSCNCYLLNQLLKRLLIVNTEAILPQKSLTKSVAEIYLRRLGTKLPKNINNFLYSWDLFWLNTQTSLVIKKTNYCYFKEYSWFPFISY